MRIALPIRLRRALTFWRRSIQARVVASTLVLSAIVISAVGWFLLQQTRDGLLRHRVDVVVGTVEAEVADTRDRLSAASGTQDDVSLQRADLIEPIIEAGDTRGYGVVLGGPEGSSAELADGGAHRTSGLELSSVPSRLETHFDGVNRATAWTYTEIALTLPDGSTESEPGIVVGSQVQLAGGRPDLHDLLPLPADRGGGDPRPGHQGPADRGRPAARARRRSHVAGDPAGGETGPDGAPGCRAARGWSPPGKAPGDR